jgi:hypothetical protein
MMVKNYQLVAWTNDVLDLENARLYMIPTLECEVQADLLCDLAYIHMEEYKQHGPISLDLARKAIRAYENMSRFEVLTGHPGDGIRYLFFATKYCISYHKELRDEFVRLCEKGVRLAKKHRCEYVLQETNPKRMLEIYILNNIFAHGIDFKP